MQPAVRLVLLALLSGIPTLSAAQTCAGDDQSSPLAAPTVQPLRAYRVEFRSPSRLAVDVADNIHVADPGSGELLVRRPDGRVLLRRAGLGRITALAVADGVTYLGDADTGALTAYGGDGKALLQLGRGAGEFDLPGDVAIDPADGRIFVSDSKAHRVGVYSAQGAHLFDLGSAGNGDGQFRYPSGIHYDASSAELLVADQFGFRVHVFDRDGVWRFCVGGSSSNPSSFFQGGRLLASPQGLWVDASGRIYVADSFEGNVKVLDRGGRLLLRIGAFGRGAGQLRVPMDLAMDGFGRLHVASANNARLEVYGIDAYQDPERYTPALLRLQPDRIEAGATGILVATLRLPGRRAVDVDSGSIAANGVPALNALVEDADRDGAPELHARFDLRELAATLNGNPAAVAVSGRLPDLQFEAIAALEVAPGAALDSDGDGVADADDLCPASAASVRVDSDGCSVGQLCDCEAARNHGQHQRCVTRTAKQWQRSGLIDRDQRRSLIWAAARSQCGRDDGARQRRDDDDRDDDKDESIERDRDQYEPDHHRERRAVDAATPRRPLPARWQPAGKHVQARDHRQDHR